MEVKKVMISSTARDLPEHRKQVEQACLKLGLFQPDMMEHLAAPDANAVGISLQIVERADVYIGIFAHRYGFVPEYDNPGGISITEMEYNRAVERGIPRLIFFMHDEHELKITDVETGDGAVKLKDLKKRISEQKDGRAPGYFKSPDDLWGKVYQSLNELREPAPHQYHYVSPIPAPPEPYVAHPYTLSQVKGLIGRQDELDLLTDWITGKSTPTAPVGGWGAVRIFNLVAIGGMGKSALTWKWFNDIAPQEWPQMAGRLWWSFYESDAYFENFIIRALAYVSRRPIEEARRVPPGEREEQLLRILDREPHLLVLDGLERILIAYARMDAAHLLADEDYDRQTANYIAQRVAYRAGVPHLAEDVAQSFTGEHRLRKTADPRAGHFLRRLAGVRASRILVSTRLYPFDLQLPTGHPRPGCAAFFLPGLSDTDGLRLWREFEVTGSREELAPLFRSFGSHPLLLQALAAEVANFRAAPGDYARWREAYPGFNPFGLALKQAKTHVLQFALQGLSEAERQVLQTIAAFRMPAQYDTLLALCCGAAGPCADESALIALLDSLEDRGLVGWDRRANRYDLHPVVRGVVWSGTAVAEQQGIYAALQRHFAAAPMVDDWTEVNALEDLTLAIELYHALVGQGLLDEAVLVFLNNIDDATLYRLSTARQRVELLEALFPDGLSQLPRLAREDYQAFACNTLALAYQYSGKPGQAVGYFKMAIEIQKKINHQSYLAVGLRNLSTTLRPVGGLCEAAAVAEQALMICQEQKDEFREGISLQVLGSALSAQTEIEAAQATLEQALTIFIKQNSLQAQGYANAELAQHFLQQSQPEIAQIHANQAWEQAHNMRHERDFIRAACRQGQVALALGDHLTAQERLNHALTRARAINFIEEELPALIALAELARRQNNLPEARDLLAEVWDPAERGPYRLLHADACNVLCQIEHDAGDLEAAKKAALQAYHLAWCDGPPWAYHYGLEMAKGNLEALGVAEPEMPGAVEPG